MRHSRSILAIGLLLSAAACGQGTTEPDALAAESGSVSVPAPLFEAGGVGWGGGQVVDTASAGSYDGTQGDSTAIAGSGNGGNSGRYFGGGQ